MWVGPLGRRAGGAGERRPPGTQTAERRHRAGRFSAQTRRAAALGPGARAGAGGPRGGRGRAQRGARYLVHPIPHGGGPRARGRARGRGGAGPAWRPRPAPAPGALTARTRPPAAAPDCSGPPGRGRSASAPAVSGGRGSRRRRPSPVARYGPRPGSGLSSGDSAPVPSSRRPAWAACVNQVLTRAWPWSPCPSFLSATD